ncbi:excinuclease ABC subunit C [Bacteroidetes oral taxon 274 str. F0058]|nr:excinuclease ABC subunit C [Bacteroidetes oral taxon 274 str. F0058]
MQESLQTKIDALPHLPGVYQFFDAKGTIIYIGKAKNLKKRVSSYFVKTPDSPKTAILVRQIVDIRYIVVKTENDALLLESNLIKRFLPRYNLMLKYGTTYPYLCITKEDFPRVFKTRKTLPDCELFGPYSIAGTLNALLELIKTIYPVRSCKLPLTEESIAKKRYKLCLEYHIKNCRGVCCGLQSKADYNAMISDIRTIAKGHSHIVEKYLLDNIKILSEQLRFEEAQRLKEKYDAIREYRQKTVITTQSDATLDVFSFDTDQTTVYINMLRVVNGSIIQSNTIEYKKNIEEVDGEVFSSGIAELREKYASEARQIVVPFVPEFTIDGVEYIVPKRDYKKELLDLSYRNVLQYKKDKYTQAQKLNTNQRNYALMNEIREMLHLDNMPHTIEMFDNSHTAGDEAVAACVVFRNLRPLKEQYRKYIIKSDGGGDDYASMKEVINRRYSRMISEGSKLPDLILADGGKGQVSAVRSVLEALGIAVPVAGLAKNDKHRTNELIFDDKVIGLKPQDSVFKFFTKMQDEVHRFAITFHRDKRSKKQVASELDDIKNIGETTKKTLLQHFKSVERIKKADFDELEKIIGKNRAKILISHFGNYSDSK